MFFLFIILIVGPGVAGQYIQGTLYSALGGDRAFYLMQPAYLNKNDTSARSTGQNLPGGAVGAQPSGASGGGGAASSGGIASSLPPFGASSAAGNKRAAATFAFDMYR
jgi:hypothetical protein